MDKCHICGGNLETMVNFGYLPLANNYVRRNLDGSFPSEYIYEGKWAWCDECALLQLVNPPSDKVMFTEDYPYRTSTSDTMLAHFGRAADLIWDTMQPKHVAEIGASDGGMIQFLADRCHVVGFEPSNECRMALARNHGIASYERFDAESAKYAVEYQGVGFDVIYSANTLRSIVGLGEILEAAEKALAPDGVLIIEEPYLPAIIESKGYDQFYDENVYCFTLSSMENIVSRYGLHVTTFVQSTVHGGSAKYYISRGDGKSGFNVLTYTPHLREQSLKSDTKKFFDDAVKSAGSFSLELSKLANNNEIIVGLGATAKSSTMLSEIGTTSYLIERIYDNTPAKIGLYTPLTHIPIVDEASFSEGDFDVCVLFAWNHAEEVKRKHPDKKFLVYAPELKYL